jgi:hypothetical protein
MSRIEKNYTPEIIKPHRFNPFTEKVIKSWLMLEIAGENDFVSINRRELDRTAALHFKDEFVLPDWRFKGVFPEDNLAFTSNVLVQNTINAAYNTQDGDTYRASLTGEINVEDAFAMASKFHERFGEEVVTTEKLDKSFRTVDDVKSFFKAVNDIPYPKARFRQLRDFICGLKKEDKNPLDLLNEAGQFNHFGELVGFRAFDGPDGEGLVSILMRKFPLAYGADIQSIGGLEFPFHKRAQLTALELHDRVVNSKQEDDSNLKPFIDIDMVGPIPDYEVPRSLRGFGIMNLNIELSDRIQNLEEIIKDSPEEVEIRAGTVIACVELLQKINKYRAFDKLSPINMCHLDFWLWSQSKNLAKDIKPHLTKTMAY